MKQIYELPSGVTVELQWEPGWEDMGHTWKSEEWGQREPHFGLYRLNERSVFLEKLSDAQHDFVEQRLGETT